MRTHVQKPEINHRFFASAPRGVVDLLKVELEALGAHDSRQAGTGVFFHASLTTAYRICVWSRLANRLLLRLGSFSAADEDGLYQAAQAIPWSAHFKPSSTFSVSLTTRRTWLSHSRYGTLRIKDGIVDQFRALEGQRPDVDPRRPDLRIYAHLERDQLALSLQLTAGALYRRKTSAHGAAAPLKENVAAAILVRAGWPELSHAETCLLDPLCGSGTLLVEGAMMAANVAPGLVRAEGLSAWSGHQSHLWEATLANAKNQVRTDLSDSQLRIIGYDHSLSAVAHARASLKALPIHIPYELEIKPLKALQAPPGPAGLMVTNPPYGVRMHAPGAQSLTGLYAQLGEKLRRDFGGWKTAIICAENAPHAELRLARVKKNKMTNGALKCIALTAQLLSDAEKRARRQRAEATTTHAIEDARTRAGPFENRLRKNFRHLSKWARRRGISCYRLYDADMPEYAFAIDLYEADMTMLHIQEYQAPHSVDVEKATQRFNDAVQLAQALIGVDNCSIYLKRRTRQRGASQYEKLTDRNRLHEVTEGGFKVLVNLSDHLDTGLFLDHRPMRTLIFRSAAGGRFLNLFSYTASATVAAAQGGAKTSISVDASRFYTQWAAQNFRLNELDPLRHRTVQADCRAWLDDRLAHPERPGFDLIFLDPPTFSNSKSRTHDFDVQRDHEEYIRKSMALLHADGELLFSTNLRHFKLAAALPSIYQIEDLGNKLLDEDFRHRPRIHHCFRFRH